METARTELILHAGCPLTHNWTTEQKTLVTRNQNLSLWVKLCMPSPAGPLVMPCPWPLTLKNDAFILVPKCIKAVPQTHEQPEKIISLGHSTLSEARNHQQWCISCWSVKLTHIICTFTVCSCMFFQLFSVSVVYYLLRLASAEGTVVIGVCVCVCVSVCVSVRPAATACHVTMLD